MIASMFLASKCLRIVLCLLSIMCLLSAHRVFGQSRDTIPFTSAGIHSIVGKNVCQFEGAKFLAGSGVDLDLSNQYAVEDRENDDNSIIGVFLISKPNLRCGIVDASLDLTNLARKGEGPAFKCYTAHEGGTTWPKWGHIIGLADNDNGLKRFVKARLAWRVDVKGKRFEELKGQSVTCDTAGYDG